MLASKTCGVVVLADPPTDTDGVITAMLDAETARDVLARVRKVTDQRGIGVLLIAFPKAHGMVLTALYLPATIMLMGLILRGVSFDFRVKARDEHKALWNRTFAAGSLIASMAQGWMLGSYLTGFSYSGWSLAFRIRKYV